MKKSVIVLISVIGVLIVIIALLVGILLGKKQGNEQVKSDTVVVKDERGGADKMEEQLKLDTIFKVNGVSFKMVYVEGCTFKMGCTSEQGGDCEDQEKPAHLVTLTKDYYIGETEVTQALWRAVMGSEPTYDGGWTEEYGRGDSYPAYYVSWDDVQDFIRELNRKTGRTFRLPTEAEWEYAARGGSKSRDYKYSGSKKIRNVAWYWDNSGGKTHPVMTKKSNELGIYDMSGNVLEWCEDWYGDYDIASQTNPKGPSTGSWRVFRGGCWNDYARNCRVLFRFRYSASYLDCNLGFRLVLEK